MFATHISPTSHRTSGKLAYFSLAILYTYGLLTMVSTLTSQIL
jgi:hypothetical protein